ncbi:MAG: hypothetical protein ACTSVI_03295 [Promethearchaeota archaeon]
MAQNRCPKCGGAMRFKRMTVHEYKKEFLVTILECKNCKFWFQALELQIDSILPVEGPCIHYIDESLYNPSKKKKTPGSKDIKYKKSESLRNNFEKFVKMPGIALLNSRFIMTYRPS